MDTSKLLLEVILINSILEVRVYILCNIKNLKINTKYLKII
jgi:hypothetical protein